MPALLSDIVDASAGRHPDRPAFRCGGSELTYAALADRTDRLAATLIGNGVRPGDRVGIRLRKSVETAVAVYGVMKAGAAFVPLDPALPPARLASILCDAGVRHLVTHDPLRQTLSAALDAGAEVDVVIGLSRPLEGVSTTVSWDEVTRAPSGPRPDRTPDDMAYFMYTSGSTGPPKGIVHTHRSGMAYARHAASVYGLRPEDRLSGFAPLHFDMSTFDYFSGPLAGAATVVIPEGYMLMPASLSALIEAERLTVWYSVPHALVSLLLRGVLDERDLTSIRWVLYGGEPFPVGHLRALMERWPHARFSNVYGPAEVNQCTYHHLPGPPASGETIPIGHVWEIAEGLVLDGDAVLSDGTVGELAIHAPTMMRGYWNRPDLDALAFYRRSSGGETHTFYRTGDLVRRDPDGTHWFIGRRDRQIKTRGYRVELDEVEAALLTHPGVAEAAVYAVPEADGSHAIHAAVVLRADSDATVEDLLTTAGDQVPRYALPVQTTLALDLPRTTSGKADRRALQQQALAAAAQPPLQ